MGAADTDEVKKKLLAGTGEDNRTPGRGARASHGTRRRGKVHQTVMANKGDDCSIGARSNGGPSHNRKRNVFRVVSRGQAQEPVDSRCNSAAIPRLCDDREFNRMVQSRKVLSKGDSVEDLAGRGKLANGVAGLVRKVEAQAVTCSPVEVRLWVLAVADSLRNWHDALVTSQDYFVSERIRAKIFTSIKSLAGLCTTIFMGYSLDDFTFRNIYSRSIAN